MSQQGCDASKMERNSILTSYIVDNELTCPENAAICNGTGCLLPLDRFNVILNTVLSIVITVMLALVMFSMGCTVDIKKFWGHIIRPWGIAIGFLCQFGIMPLTAFVLSLAFDVHPVQAIVILIMGCCPGGTGSNILAYWVDGDMDLRMVTRVNIGLLSAALRLVTRCLPWLPVKTSLNRCHTRRFSEVYGESSDQIKFWTFFPDQRQHSRGLIAAACHTGRYR
ncbi:unnamed protein product [Ranitomeya imitator]|uniref:Ileal sodium/bile acid cotransporter n=1 Tax=Ranitomeya imitator TaxID=111125 RepID=A0ABN9LVM8_9NEOB|nr:unnamed protein product [Ranitomeya imitator]